MENGRLFRREQLQVKEDSHPVAPVDDGLTPEAKTLFQKYQQILYRPREDESEAKIKVGSALSTLAFFYERFRNTIDYREDQTLLRSSIERVSKRLLWENPSRAIDTLKLSESLVKELIWAKYIKNGSLPQSRLKTIAFSFAKYLRLLSLVSDNGQRLSKKITWRDWILGVCAGEIEEIIRPETARFDVLTQEVVDWFFKRYEWEDARPNENLKKLHIWAAVYRSLLKADLTSLRYHLLKRFFPQWFEIGPDKVAVIKDSFIIFAKNIEAGLNSKDHLKLYRLMSGITPSFLILSEVAEDRNSPALLSDNRNLAREIEMVCQKKYSEIKGRVARGITRSVIYIFITKMFFALLLEIPYEIFFLQGVRYVPVVINITLPPFFMFLVGLMIKKPSDANTRKISERIFDFIYGTKEKKIAFSLYERKKRGLAAEFFEFFYAVFFVLVMGLISYGLYRLNFSLVSTFVFFVFLSLVLLFGFRVKRTASEFNVVGDDEEFFSNMVSLVFLPFLNIGYWLSGQLAKLNFLIIILDFLIEAPLKNILAVLEDWNIFMKEKRRDIVDTPNS